MKQILFLCLTLLLTHIESKAQTSSIKFKTAFLVDVRTPMEFKEGSVPGAVNIPLSEIQQRIQEFKGKDQVVVFCRSGNRSSQAEYILKSNHIARVINGGTWQMVDQQKKLQQQLAKQKK